MRRQLLFAGTLLACAVPGAILAFKNVVDPFHYFRLFRVELVASAGHFQPIDLAVSTFNPVRLGLEALLAMIGIMGGVGANELSVLPLGSFIVPIGAWVLTYSLTRNLLLSALIAIYLGFYHGMILVQYNTFLYAFVHFLFLIFVSLLQGLRRDNATARIVALLMLFVATFFMYHTVSLWMVIALFGIACYSFVVRRMSPRLKSGPASVPSLFSLALASLVTYLFFDRVIYAALQRSVLGTNEALGAFATVFAAFSQLIGQQSEALGQYELANVTNRASATFSIVVTATIFLGLLAAAVAWALARRHRDAPGPSSTIAEKLGPVWAASAVILFHTLGYAAYGTLSLRPVYLLLPSVILGFLSGRRLRFAIIWCSSLACASVLGFFALNASLASNASAPSLTGLSQLIEGGTITTDLLLYGKLLVVDTPPLPELSVVNNKTYEGIVDGRIVDSLLVLDVDPQSRVVYGLDWRYFQPFIRYKEQVRNNASAVVFDSGTVIVAVGGAR